MYIYIYVYIYIYKENEIKYPEKMVKSIVFIKFFFSGWIFIEFFAICIILLAVCFYYVVGNLLTICRFWFY